MALPSSYENYKDKYKTVKFDRTEDGIVTMAMHTNGDSVFWDFVAHDECAWAFAELAGDYQAEVVIYTGTGNDFNAAFDWGAVDKGELPPAEMMAYPQWTGHHLLTNMLEIQVPIIAAVNGPCAMHSELVLMADIVICSEDTYFQDASHFPMGVVPGDGMHIVWPMVVGHNRARYFLTTGMKLSAQQALEWGAVNEVVPKDQVMTRAMELAKELAKKPPMTRKATRHLLTQPFRKAVTAELSHGIAQELWAQRAFWPKGNTPLVNRWDSEDPFGSDKK